MDHPHPAGHFRNPYLEWRASESVPVYEGFGIDCTGIELGPAARVGGLGAYVDVAGRGDYCDVYVAEIPPAGALNPEQHLCDKLIYVLSGHGSTVLELRGNVKHVFEWGPGSLFGIPLNVRHQQINGSGTEPARFAAVSTLPIFLKLFHAPEFIFGGANHDFTDRILDEKYVIGEGRYIGVKPGQNQWETLLVPDLRNFELPNFDARGPGSKHLHFLLGEATMHAHMAEMPAGKYKKAHRHPGGANIFCVTGHGYSLLWLEGQTLDEAVRFDWKPGTVYAPPDEYFHQHFNLADEPSRYLALSFGGIRYPTLEAKKHMYQNLDVAAKDGGTQIDYEDEDSRVYERFVAELAGAGAELTMPRPSYTS